MSSLHRYQHVFMTYAKRGALYVLTRSFSSLDQALLLIWVHRWEPTSSNLGLVPFA
jgi:hypothetical protein